MLLPCMCRAAKQICFYACVDSGVLRRHHSRAEGRLVGLDLLGVVADFIKHNLKGINILLCPLGDAVDFFKGC